ncbi:hypothetical protein MVEN_02499400 [Mycena venus]|uniref:F-box domain-containing protein n=1 Tax=Mycena venus TaxID=2733690 RepID=A0A8H6WRX4_9AGAR|nr:hypothetical protein MVEN_02499400 [Mycena venus]
MSNLPVELLLAIAHWVKDLDSSLLFNLRLVSKTLNAVAAPLVLRAVTVGDDVQSADGFACLQAGGAATTNAVQEVVFQGNPAQGHVWGEEDISGEAGRAALCIAFSGLAKFRNLRILRFEFHNYFHRLRDSPTLNDTSHFLDLQLELFAVLAAHPPPPLVSLTLINITAAPHSLYISEAFQNIFRPLRTLHISVICDNQRAGAYQQAPLCDFWEVSVPSVLKSATCLTSLNIRSDFPVGVRPAVPMTIHFPALTVLSLRNFILDPAHADYDILEFIVRHKSTLTRLELDECAVYGGEPRTYPRPWHAVLHRLRDELVGLHTLHLTPVESYVDPGPFGYLALLPGTYYLEDYQAATEAKDLNKAALQSMMSTVYSRRAQDP